MSTFWTDCYRAHFQRYFHKPFDVRVYHAQDDFALKIGIHDWAAQNYKLYASLGLADRLALHEHDDLGEVVLFVDVPDQEVLDFFVSALFFILHHDIPLGKPFSIGGASRMEAALRKRYHKSALYFTAADSEDPAFGHVRNGDEFGRVYQAYFISPEEDAYLEEVGAEQFEDRWRAQSGDLLSLRRPSFV